MFFRMRCSIVCGSAFLFHYGIFCYILKVLVDFFGLAVGRWFPFGWRGCLDLPAQPENPSLTASNSLSLNEVSLFWGDRWVPPSSLAIAVL